MLAIKQAGGVAIVQDPATALTPDMPQSALDYVEVDHCIPAAEIGRLLGEQRLKERETCEIEAKNQNEIAE